MLYIAGVSLADIQRPAEVFLYSETNCYRGPYTVDEMNGPYGMNDPNDPGWAYSMFARRHNGVANVAFFDGHVKALRTYQWTNIQNH